MRVVIMGAPGAGKGTQAELLTERLGVPHVATGNILREAIAAGTPLGVKARQAVEQGLLVPDDVVIGIVKERLAAEDCAAGFVLDGFPRTVGQAEALDRFLAARREPLSAVIEMKVPRDELVQRIADRRLCRSCGTVFSTSVDAAARTPSCPKCGGQLYQRADDLDDTILQRMDVYGRETAPVLDYYRRKGLLREILGTGSRDDVYARVADSVG